MLRVQKVRLRFLGDPTADQLPIPNGRRCNERGRKLVLRFYSIRNLQASPFGGLEHTAVRRVLFVDSVQEIYFDSML